MTIQEAYTTLIFQLRGLYDNREAANIADLVMEHITGFRRTDRVLNRGAELNEIQQQKLINYARALLQHQPVQYVLYEAWFAGMKLYVDENVLIPRPETEELVHWILKEAASRKLRAASILDIGTGSGCIPIALKKQLPAADVHALDISDAALTVAKRNAIELNAEVIFHHFDILKQQEWEQLPSFDIIVSNPPYIRQAEQNEMRQNVLQYEPHLALFVPGDDALVFYKAITKFALQKLNASGMLFFEINEAYGKEIAALLETYGYSEIETRKDMQGKERMIKAKKQKE